MKKTVITIIIFILFFGVFLTQAIGDDSSPAYVFSDQELDFMRQQYSEELANAEKYIEQIKEVLRKIGGSVKLTKEELVENEPKQRKKRGRKSQVKVVEPKEPKKRGRKPKAALPTPIVQPPKRRGRQPKLSVPTPEQVESAVPTPVAKKGTKKATPKPKKKIAPKPKIAKPAVIKKAPKVTPSKEPVPTSELIQALKKEITKVVKKKNTRKRRFTQKGVRLAPLSKPLPKKEPIPEPVSENPPAVEPIIVPTEEPKE